MDSIPISEDVHRHLSPHFQKGQPGSKFFCESPEELLDLALKKFPQIFSEAKPDADGRIRISLQFTEPIGTSNVVSIDSLTAEEKNKIEVVDRQGKQVRVVRTDRAVPTCKCQIILSSDWQLITMFPGEPAPSLPSSPEVPDAYWDHHVFVEPVSK